MLNTTMLLTPYWKTCASLTACLQCSSQLSVCYKVNSLNIRNRSRQNSFGRYLLHQASHQQSFPLIRLFSSKTPPKSSLAVPAAAPESETSKAVPGTVAVSLAEPTITETSLSQLPKADPVPYFSGVDLRTADESTKLKIHRLSSEVAAGQAQSLINARNRRKRKEILRMDESEYEHTFVLKKRPPLLDRRGENETFYYRSFEVDKVNHIDYICALQVEPDIRPRAVKRWWAYHKLQAEIEDQMKKPLRNKILGMDLAAAHFLVFRKAKVKFLGQKEWITEYRKDAKPGVPEEDLPIMKFELCTLPTKFDPRYRLEAIDATQVRLHYEGLSNLENLQYLKWLSLKESPFIDDWCLDKIARMFHETLEYIDLSGCKNVTDRGIGTLHRCRNLKAIRLENLPHIEDLEIVSALLEDHLPDLQVIGVDFAGKTQQLRLEGEELERKALLEASTTNDQKPDASSPTDTSSPVSETNLNKNMV